MSAPARKSEVLSAGNTRTIRVRRGRPSNIRLLNRQRVFGLLGSFVSARVMTAWIRATVASLKSWDEPRAAEVFETVGLLFGEVLAAGTRAEPEVIEQARLPFGLDDAARVAEADGELVGTEAFAVFADLLLRNVAGPWVARATEALDDREHPAHVAVWRHFSSTVDAVIAAGMKRGANADGEVPVKPDGVEPDPVVKARAEAVDARLVAAAAPSWKQ